MGSIVTFYSYKGGVGRTMAVANIAVLLSQMGLRVLAIDWDLEAPGLDKYFKQFHSFSVIEEKGLLDLLTDTKNFYDKDCYDIVERPDWQDYVLEFSIGGKHPLSLMTSGMVDQSYTKRLLSFNWKLFFTECNGGDFIESLRDEWRSRFDVTLIDSRTGLTDSGGICTIQLPDILTLVFTANEQSLNGVKQVALKAQKARQKLAFDRTSSLVFPLASRFDSRTEHEESQQWLKRFAEELQLFYRDWLPKNISPLEILRQTKLPYVAYYSFGEKLPVIEDTSDPDGMGHAYQKAAHLISKNFSNAADLVSSIPISSSSQKLEGICPYKGLEYFDYNDQDPQFFYGRERLIDSLLDHIKKNNFLAILGASGSGKSSALRAGLLHQLKLGRIPNSQDWKIQIMLPGKTPLKNLFLSWLDPNLSDFEKIVHLDTIESLSEQEADRLIQLVQKSTAKKIVLVIDQFEELFTLCQDLDQRKVFCQCLLEALEKTDNKLCLIIAMRTDFFGKSFEEECSGLGDKIHDSNNFIVVPSMEVEGLRQAIIRPAKKVNLNVEPELVQQIVTDIKGAPGSLPLLQYTLKEIWHLRKDNRLKLATYFQLGGIGGALDRKATEVYNNLNESEQDTTKHIFLALTNLEEDTSRRILKENLITSKHNEKLLDNVIQKLSNEKLIVIRDWPENRFEIGKKVEVEVAHEAIIKHWVLLNKWLNESRDKLRTQRKIEEAAQDWELSGKRSDYLLSKQRLQEAKDFHKNQKEKYPLSKSTESFITASIKYQRNQRIKLSGIFLGFATVGTIIVGTFVINEINLSKSIQLIRYCQDKEICNGRIEALENLVRANRSLKSYNLENANLESANLENANFASANLTRANLESVNLENANLESANLTGVFLTSATLTGANLKSATLTDANLTDANLTSVYLIGADLTDANLTDANLTGADLTDANLTDANLTDTNLTDADLTDANFIRANLESANLTRANLIKVQNLTSSQIKSACFWEQAYYKGSLNDNNKWKVDTEANRRYINRLKQDTASDPKEPIDCQR